MEEIVYPISEHEDLCSKVGPVYIDTIYGYGYAPNMLGWHTTVTDTLKDDWDSNTVREAYSKTYEEAVIEHEKHVVWCEKHYNTVRKADWGSP